MYQGVFGVVTWHALYLVQKHSLSVELPLKPCTGSFTKAMGLPCAHVYDERRASTLLATDFYPHWYWDREKPKLPILEPVRLARWTKACTAKNTNRELSGFEYLTPCRALPTCSACFKKGYTMSSRSCPNRVYAAMAESNQQARHEQELSLASPVLRVPQSPYTPVEPVAPARGPTLTFIPFVAPLLQIS
jgi:hypothetical protein